MFNNGGDIFFIVCTLARVMLMTGGKSKVNFIFSFNFMGGQSYD